MSTSTSTYVSSLTPRRGPYLSAFASTPSTDPSSAHRSANEISPSPSPPPLPQTTTTTPIQSSLTTTKNCIATSPRKQVNCLQPRTKPDQTKPNHCRPQTVRNLTPHNRSINHTPDTSNIPCHTAPPQTELHPPLPRINILLRRAISRETPAKKGRGVGRKGLVHFTSNLREAAVDDAMES